MNIEKIVAETILKTVMSELPTFEESLQRLKGSLKISKQNIDKLENNYGVFTKISHLIKNKEIVFKYGLFPVDMLKNRILIGFDSDGKKSNYFLNEGYSLSHINMAGLANIDGIDILQVYSYSTNEVFYGLLFNKLTFKELPNLTTLKELKIVFALRSWQALMNSPADKDLYFLKHIKVPLKYRQCKNVLYRGLKIRGSGLKRIKKGLTIRLEDRMFSSWSEDKNASLIFGTESNPKAVGLVMTHHPTVKEVLINVEKFSKEIFAPHSSLLMTHEKEVILLNTPKILELHKDQVEYMIGTNRKLIPFTDFLETQVLREDPKNDYIIVSKN